MRIKIQKKMKLKKKKRILVIFLNFLNLNLRKRKIYIMNFLLIKILRTNKSNKALNNNLDKIFSIRFPKALL